MTLTLIATYITGSSRGYIHVANRGIESALRPLQPVAGLRGNIRKAMQYFAAKGATHYTVAHFQGVPSKGYSNQYCYAAYYGYKEDTASPG